MDKLVTTVHNKGEGEKEEKTEQALNPWLLIIPWLIIPVDKGNWTVYAARTTTTIRYSKCLNYDQKT